MTEPFTPKYIPIADVPEEKGKWYMIFSKIPAGQALVLDSKEYNAKVIRSALHHYHKRHNEFLTYRVLFRAGKVYVLHPSIEGK